MPVGSPPGDEPGPIWVGLAEAPRCWAFWWWQWSFQAADSSPGGGLGQLTSLTDVAELPGGTAPDLGSGLASVGSLPSTGAVAPAELANALLWHGSGKIVNFPAQIPRK